MHEMTVGELMAILAECKDPNKKIRIHGWNCTEPFDPRKIVSSNCLTKAIEFTDKLVLYRAV